MNADTGGASHSGCASPEEIEQALDTLDVLWIMSGYEFGYDPGEGCWWALRPGQPGSRLEANGPEELNGKLADREAAGP
jgi:hypothetical protein